MENLTGPRDKLHGIMRAHLHEEIKSTNCAAADGHPHFSISNIHVTMYVNMSEPYGSTAQGRKAKWHFYRD